MPQRRGRPPWVVQAPAVSARMVGQATRPPQARCRLPVAWWTWTPRRASSTTFSSSRSRDHASWEEGGAAGEEAPRDAGRRRPTKDREDRFPFAPKRHETPLKSAGKRRTFRPPKRCREDSERSSSVCERTKMRPGSGPNPALGEFLQTMNLASGYLGNGVQSGVLMCVLA